jgi:hypothetical protein
LPSPAAVDNNSSYREVHTLSQSIGCNDYSKSS